MNAIKALKIAAGVFVIAVSVNAHAQSSEAATAAPAASSAAPSAKSAKAANKQLAKNVRRALAKTKGLTSTEHHHHCEGRRRNPGGHRAGCRANRQGNGSREGNRRRHFCQERADHPGDRPVSGH